MEIESLKVNWFGMSRQRLKKFGISQNRNQTESVGSEVLEDPDFFGHFTDLNSFQAAQRTTAEITTYQKLHSEAWLGDPKNGSSRTL